MKDHIKTVALAGWRFVRNALSNRQADTTGVAATIAARDVLAERRRQIDVEGWTPEHDDEHRPGALAVAAACYAALALPSRPASEVVSQLWTWTGWSWQFFKPKGPRHNLICAAALILAEIERMDRAAITKAGQADTGGATC